MLEMKNVGCGAAVISFTVSPFGITQSLLLRLLQLDNLIFF